MRHRRQQESQPPQLNLAPIMNMVVILIPLLLLSVVFLSVGVINVSSPPATLDGEPTDEPPSLQLAVAVTHDGFQVSTRDGAIRPVDGCPADGPTICLSGDERPAELFRQAKTSFETGRHADGSAALEQAARAYDWSALYESLKDVKKKHADETTVRITAEPDVPYMMVVRTMDLARFEVDRTSFDDPSEVWRADKKRPLFPDPVLAIAQ